MLECLEVYESPELLDLGSLDAFAHTCSSGTSPSNGCNKGSS